MHFSASCLMGPIFRVQTITFSAVRVSKRRVPSKKKPGVGKTEKRKTGYVLRVFSLSGVDGTVVPCAC